MLSASFRRQLPRWPVGYLQMSCIASAFQTHTLLWLDECSPTGWMTWMFTEMFSLAVLSTPGHIILM